MSVVASRFAMPSVSAFNAASSWVRPVVAQCGHDKRGQDTYSTLLACAAMTIDGVRVRCTLIVLDRYHNKTPKK